jgi:hypothetical protein
LIGKQRKRHQHSRDQAQKSYQLVEPFVFRRCQKAQEFLLSFWGRLSAAAGAGAIAIPLEERSNEEIISNGGRQTTNTFSVCVRKTRGWANPAAT